MKIRMLFIDVNFYAATMKTLPKAGDWNVISTDGLKLNVIKMLSCAHVVLLLCAFNTI